MRHHLEKINKISNYAFSLVSKKHIWLICNAENPYIVIISRSEQMKLHKNRYCLFFSILMLTSLTILFQNANATVGDHIYKIDDGFYEKILEMQKESQVSGDSDQAETHSIIIVTDNGYELQLQETLREINANIVFVDTTLDFIIADVPINQIISLVVQDSVLKIGDGTEPLEPQGLTMSQAKATVGARNIPSTSYSYTGQGMIIGVIDTGVDFSHPSLQNKQAGKTKCGKDVCESTNTVHDHGTALAAIIAADSNNNIEDGIAHNARIYDVVSNSIARRTSS